MECPAASELMSLRLDDALSGQEVRALDEHLATCVHCSAEWERMQRACAPFVGMAVRLAEPPAQFTAQVMRRVQRHRNRLSWAKVGLSLLLIGLIMTTLFVAPLRAIFFSGAAAGEPALVSIVLGTLSGVASVAATVWRAMTLIVRSVLASPTWLVALAYVAVCAVVAVGWAKLVLLPRRVD